MRPSHVGSLVLTALGLVSLSACGAHDEDDGVDLAAVAHDLAGADFSFLSPPPQDFDDTGPPGDDPTTCAEAATTRSYIGCDYWPTVTGNAVWSVFDFAVVISNPGTATAVVKLSGGALPTTTVSTVAPGALVKIGLPWVPSLKGPDADASGNTTSMTASVKAVNGAYHLVSDVPVLVYQFNALEYKSGAGNDLKNVAWSTCPASGIPCFSYSNDASLLIPSTAMTPNYVVTGIPGDSTSGTPPVAIGSSYAVITGTVDHTIVKILFSKTGDVLASNDVPVSIAAVAQNATTPATASYTINAGDVLELIDTAGATNDLTGSLVEASQPVQLIVGNPCTTNPANNGMGNLSCDHIEESVLPVETWGKAYVVTAPSGPNVTTVQHTVRIYGGATAANLSFTPSVTGAPASIAASAVVTFTTTTDFYVSGDQPFAVSSEQLSGEIVDAAHLNGPNGPSGDPSLSFFSAVEQYRTKYLFLAPTDYDSNFVDVAIPIGTTLKLDGLEVVSTPEAIPGTGYEVVRVTLTAGAAFGAHTLVASQPFGIQVMGYGSATSYQYPGGLNLKVIAPPPPSAD